jgi:hypothetical protein
VWHGDIMPSIRDRQKITEAVAQNRAATLNAEQFTQNQSLF